MSNPFSNLPSYVQITILFGVAIGLGLGGVSGIKALRSILTDTEVKPSPLSSVQPMQTKVEKVEIEIYDNDTQQPLSDVDVELRTSVGLKGKGKTDINGFVLLTVSEQKEKRLQVNLNKKNYESPTTYIDISSPEKHTIFLKKKGIIRTYDTQGSLNTSTPNSNTPTLTSSDNAPLIKGFWDIKIDVTNDTDVYKNGQIRVKHITLLAFFEQENNKFKGHIENATGGACQGKDETSISGLVQGKAVRWEVRYPGKCCRDGEMVFDGAFDISTGTIEGKLKPTHPSSSGCTLLEAKVSMRPRES
jgi:hypothetical protein